MSNVIEFPKIPLWNPNLTSEQFSEFILNETNFESFQSEIEGYFEDKIEYSIFESECLEIVQNHINEFGYVVMELEGLD